MSLSEKEMKQEFEADYKVDPHSDAYNKCMSVLDEALSIKPSAYKQEFMLPLDRDTEHRGDGLSTHYYTLPEGATELRHIIKHKKMEHGVGEAFCSLYRLNDNGEYLRNLKKAKFYIDAAIEYEENQYERD